MALYFAYGSNMLAARLVARCPSARVIGRADVTGFRVAFDKIGQDGSGKATLVAGEGVVPGVLYDLADADVNLLDQIEGLGRGYDRVTLDLGDRQAMAYLAPPQSRAAGMPPFDWYLALVLAGAREAGLPGDWIARLAAEPAIPDPEPDRPRRVEALALLAG
ncbi:gamma-glutamylcyclotransferase family protein [Paracoccus xiamenensis]|uniref:gamma-glutamylcyclotransferase family protein n=1 Tax=Paracoccus xiamenensis TaxID=2714901 RepID=UPI00140CDF37|nr:gamma-glutamylcyclotransferase family protein [Paracoccus xiamenensis]NHF73817.1 gamma-glutamylcyclotransferase [Paracoccus xiamenensis]